jgi:hypothetical protein
LCKGWDKEGVDVSYNPQQNGVVERKNRAIVGAAKAMLYDQDLPRFLWPEACNTAVYIQNRSPHRVLGRKTPKEVFTRRKQETGHFWICGCLVYCHIPSEKRTKLEATAEKGIFVGYSETSKAHRIYIPAFRKTLVKRDVKFEEDRTLKKAHDIVPTKARDQELETQKEEETQVTSTGTDAKTTDQDEEQEAPSVPDSPSSRRTKTKWVQQTLREAQEYVGAPRTSIRESRAPQRFSSYMGLMSKLLEVEPSNFQEASQQQVWRDAMVEEYASIMKNDIWEVVP